MGESQGFTAYEAELTDALKASLSEPRLDPYIADRAGVEAHGIKLYLWNARVAKAFLFPLQAVEVVTRNAIHAGLARKTGQADWLINPPANLLTKESEDSRLATVQRMARQNIPLTSDNLVAALTFDFWSNLFRDEYDLLWDAATLVDCFPHYPAKADRSFIQRRAKRLNHLRNRIAHHEPVWSDPNLTTRFAECEEVVGLVCPKTAQWMSQHSTVLATLRFPFEPDAQFVGRPLHSFTFEVPMVLPATTALAAAAGALAKGGRNTVVVVQDNSGLRVIEPLDILKFIDPEFQETGGMADVTAATIQDLLPSNASVVEEVASTMSTGDALALFFRSRKERRARPTHLAVIHNGALTGIIRRPTLNFSH